jgi:hypothetical protein
MLTEFPVIAKDTLAADSRTVTLLLTIFALGIGAGSLLAGRLLKGEASPRHVPFAALGLSLFALDFAWSCGHAGTIATVAALLAAPSGWRLLGDLFLLALCGGIGDDRADPHRRAAIHALVADEGQAAPALVPETDHDGSARHSPGGRSGDPGPPAPSDRRHGVAGSDGRHRLCQP